MLKKITIITLSLAASVLLFGVAVKYMASASNQYNLISNHIYLNKNAMTKNQIRDFLVSKGGAVANYKDKGVNDSKKESAHTLIYNAAQAWGINPQVLIATLQKEQSLITQKNPSSVAYRSAMGYGCPDGAACNKIYYGFANQVNMAAYQFRYNYEALKGNSSFVDGDGDKHGVGAFACNQSTHFYDNPLLPGNTVKFARNTAFKSSKDRTVTIANEATASLLCYTPHVGPYATTGYSGSDNFTYWFNQWFGSPISDINLSAISFKQQPFVGNEITATFKVTNLSKKTIDLGQLNIVVRDPSGKNLDSPLSSNVRIGAGKSYTYSESMTLDGTEGEYRFHIGRFQNDKWTNFSAYGLQTNQRSNFKETVPLQPVVTESISVTPAQDTTSPEVHKNQSVRATYKVENPSTKHAVSIENIVVAGRDPSNSPADFPKSGAVTLQPGQTYTYDESKVLQSSGKYRFWVSSHSKSYGWNSNLLASQSSSINQSINKNSLDTVTVTGPVSLSTSSSPARTGDTITGEFTIKNYGNKSVTVGPIGLAGRDPDNKSVDMEMKRVSLSPGQTYTYKSSRNANKPGNYRYWISSNRAGIGWDSGYPTSEAKDVVRSKNLAVRDAVTITSDMQLSTSAEDARIGDTIEGRFTVKNHSAKSVTVGPIGLAGRDPDNRPFDMEMKRVKVDPGKSYTYTSSRKASKPGEYRYWVSSNRAGIGWDSTYPSNEETGTKRSSTALIKDVVTVTSPLQLTSNGSLITGTFTVKNFGNKTMTVGPIGLAGRNPSNKSYDMEMKRITLKAGESYTYKSSRNISQAGTYRYWISSNRAGVGWDSTYPMSEDSGTARSRSISTAN